MKVDDVYIHNVDNIIALIVDINYLHNYVAYKAFYIRWDWYFVRGINIFLKNYTFDEKLTNLLNMKDIIE